MREWIARREERGIYHQLVKELEVEDRAAYLPGLFSLDKRAIFVSRGKIEPLIAKQEQPLPINNVRSTIKPDERFAATLRFLATGESFHHSSTLSEFLDKQYLQLLFNIFNYCPTRFNLQRYIVARQVVRKCYPLYFTFTVLNIYLFIIYFFTNELI